MADQKITDLSSLSSSDLSVGDLLAIVDTSDTSMATSGTNKKVSLGDLHRAFGPTVVSMFPSGVLTTLTNLPSAEALSPATNRHCKVDLTLCNQARLVVVVGAVMGASGSKLTAKYATTHTNIIGSFLALGTSAIECAIDVSTQTTIDSGWIDLASGAKGDRWVHITHQGGDGVVDPQIHRVDLHFR